MNRFEQKNNTHTQCAIRHCQIWQWQSLLMLWLPKNDVNFFWWKNFQKILSIYRWMNSNMFFLFCWNERIFLMMPWSRNQPSTKSTFYFSLSIFNPYLGFFLSGKTFFFYLFIWLLFESLIVSECSVCVCVWVFCSSFWLHMPNEFLNCLKHK